MQKSVKKRLFVVLLCLMALMALCFSLVACGGDTKYKLTIADYDTEQGTVTVTPEAEGNEYKKDTEVTVEARGKEGYVVDTFTVDTNADASLNNEGKFTFKITADTTITVTFKSTTVKVTGVALDKETLALEIGGLATKAEATLQATVSPTNATNKNVSWASDAEGIATVDSTGKVTAVAVGTANITVTTEDGGMTKTCAVTVAQHQHSAAAGATYTPLQDGENHSYECETCGQTVQEKHTMDTKWHSGQDGHYHECEKCHVPDLPQQHSQGSGSLTNKGEDGHSYVCVVCENTITVPHNLGAKESEGESGHKQSCACGYSTTVTGHTLVYEQTSIGQGGAHKQVCTECDYETTPELHSATWQTDATQHWKGCVCGWKTQVSNHTWTWRVDDDGKHYQYCADNRMDGTGQECGYETPHEAHIPSGDWQKEADKHYKICSECSNHCLESSHSDVSWHQEEGWHTFTCNTCGYTSEQESHTRGGDNRHCSKCGYDMREAGCDHPADQLTYKANSDGTHVVHCEKCHEDVRTDNCVYALGQDGFYSGDGGCDLCGGNQKFYTFASGVINAYIGDSNGLNYTKIKLPAQIGGVDVTGIKAGTNLTNGPFYNASITEIDFSTATNLTLIGAYAFCSSKLTTVSVPDGVALGKGAFANCAGLLNATIGNGQAVLNSMFSGCGQLQKVVLNCVWGVERIGQPTMDQTFKDCTSLQTVVINCIDIQSGKTSGTLSANAFSGASASVKVYIHLSKANFDAGKCTIACDKKQVYFFYESSPSEEEQAALTEFGGAWHYGNDEIEIYD